MTRSPAPAVTRAAAVLGVLAESSDPVGLAELARRLGLPKSSIANICSALVDAGLVRRVDGRYRLGHVVLEHRAFLGQRPERGRRRHRSAGGRKRCLLPSL